MPLILGVNLIRLSFTGQSQSLIQHDLISFQTYIVHNIMVTKIKFFRERERERERESLGRDTIISMGKQLRIPSLGGAGFVCGGGHDDVLRVLWHCF